MIDELDEILTNAIVNPAKEIIGTKMTGKRKLKFEPLSSPKLEIMGAQTNFPRLPLSGELSSFIDASSVRSPPLFMTPSLWFMAREPLPSSIKL